MHDIRYERMNVQTIQLHSRPRIAAHYAVVGKKEAEGPLSAEFDLKYENDDSFGESSWEKSETCLQKKAYAAAVDISGEPDIVFGGDLLAQCSGTAFAMRGVNVPVVGLYGACSTFAEAIALGAVFVDGGYAKTAAAVTSSHFCSVGRQFRFPIMYGEQRTPTAQWTVTGAGCAVIGVGNACVRSDVHTCSNSGVARDIVITAVTFGKIIDMNITDATDMGSAMAGAAFDTLSAHLSNTGKSPADFDVILTGDLGAVGSAILRKLRPDMTNHNDCGLLIYSSEQDVNAGGSGAGCSASVLCGHMFKEMERKNVRTMLFIATGALLSPVTALQGESIPAIAHCVEFSLA
ncbi:stage V sporulation protein AD [Clostridia bacterium]|nr:stage V sporulation protein AD [Clostridia bacterium]